MLQRLHLLSALALLFTTAAHAQQYQLTDITPPGTTATASALNMYGQSQVGGTVFVSGNFSLTNATIWNISFLNGAAAAPINLHPVALFDLSIGAGRSAITGIAGISQVGYGSGPATSQQIRAVAWRGDAASAAILPVPFASFESKALGIGEDGIVGQIVGYANTVQTVGGRGTIHTFGGPPHAILWDEDSHNAVDIHNGAQGTVAVAAAFSKQVGYGGSWPPVTSSLLLEQPKAMMWNYPARGINFVWLHPTQGYQSSAALATDGIQEAGWAQLQSSGGRTTTALPTHAAVWMNTAASFVDLNPIGMVNSFALGVSQGKQVGYGLDVNNFGHALVWSGSAASAIDLNQYLPLGTTGAAATSIDSSGNISGYMVIGTERHAIVWSIVQ